MKNFNLDTQFTFGKHKGKTVAEVLHENPTYLNWCMINLDHFFIADEDLESIVAAKPGFALSTEAEAVRQQKLEKMEAASNDDDYEYDSASHTRRRWSHDELADGDWDYDYRNPSHDPSDNPWIDVFGPGDEAEAAYWNTD
jgi:hypothetical protein